MFERNEKEFEAVKENLISVQEYLGSYLDNVHCSMKVRMQIDIAVEEIFINIVNYAYGSETGKVTVCVEISENPLVATITFMDQGIPYNPLAKEDPNINMSAEERQIGGLGIFMTKNVMDEMFYEYKDGKNILTLKKVI